MNRLLQRLQDPRPCLLDGAMGTQLQLRGLPTGLRPEGFCFQQPEILQNIHEDYLRAGADIILTGTFGGSCFKLPPDLVESIGVVEFNRRMAKVALAAVAAVGVPAFVGGDMGPSGHFVVPLGDLSPEALFAGYADQARGLAEGGVDLFVVETQFDLAETRLIVAGIRSVSDLPIFASMSFEGETSLTGTTPEILVATMANLGVTAVGLNCGIGPEGMLPLVSRFVAAAKGTGLYVYAEPNAGLPELIDDETVYRLPPKPFSEQTAAFLGLGISIVGGCCGTTPEHIRQLRQRADAFIATQPSPIERGVMHLTTRTKHVQIGLDLPVCCIGGRINPLENAALQTELQAGDTSLAVDLTEEQLDNDVSVVDVNVCAPKIDEQALLPELIREVTLYHSAPLSLTASSVEAVRGALLAYPASVLVNAFSGDEGCLESLGGICRDFGAPFIVRPLQGQTVPLSAAERIAIIKTVVKQAEDLGISRNLMLIDVLAMDVMIDPGAATACIDTISWCYTQGFPTIMGSTFFAQPAQSLFTASFLSTAIEAGLSAYIDTYLGKNPKKSGA